MMRGLGLVDEMGELGGVQIRSMAAARADTGGVRGGGPLEMAEACHLTKATSCAQRCQWLLIHALRRQLVYARPGVLDIYPNVVVGLKKSCHTALRVSLVA